MAEDVVKGVATPDMMNAIKDEASQAYKDAVPTATAFNLQDVGNPILNYKAVRNEFLDALVNKIIGTLARRKLWTNPLAILKKGDLPLGMDLENVHVNPAAERAYDGTETGMADILKMHKPDVASEYFRMNRQGKYVVTINNRQLQRAFTSWGALENLIAYIVDSLYNGNTIDEYEYTKSLVSAPLAAGQVQKRIVQPVTNEATARAFLKVLRSLSVLFTFPSTAYNNYKLFGGPENPRVNWADIGDQVILIRADVASDVGIDVLATLFHVEYADYLARQIVVDNFNDDTTLAVLASRNTFQIYEELRSFEEFWNSSSLGWQYYYHAWDLFAMSSMENCVAITTE